MVHIITTHNSLARANHMTLVNYKEDSIHREENRMVASRTNDSYDLEPFLSAKTVSSL